MGQVELDRKFKSCGMDKKLKNSGDLSMDILRCIYLRGLKNTRR
jgi:hypothetical protein